MTDFLDKDYAHTKPPERIIGVSQSQFSVARHYGGCTYNGHHYHYDADTDTLIRQDVWQAQLKGDKEAKAEHARQERAKWAIKQKSFAEF